MAYEPINWKDFPNEETPLSSFNLNHMDTQIKKNADAVDVLKPFKTEAEKKFSQIDKELANSKVIEADGTNFELTTSEGGVLIKHMEGASSQDGTPTPDNPIEIKSADVNITSRTANLIPFPYYWDSRAINGVNFTVLNDGCVLADGTATATTIFHVWYRASIDIKEGKKYRLSGCPSGGGSSSKYKMDILYSGGTLATDIGNGGIFVGEEFSDMRIVIYNGQTVNLIFKPMLTEVAEDETYPTEYIPPFSTKADTSITLRAIGDVKDELQFVNDKFQIVRRVGYINITEDEVNTRFSYSSSFHSITATATNFANVHNIKYGGANNKLSGVICNRLVEVTRYDMVDMTPFISFNGEGQVNISNGISTSKNDFISWLRTTH